MPISVNTNLAALTAQNSLKGSTTKMNTAMERLTTGFKINNSKRKTLRAVKSYLVFRHTNIQAILTVHNLNICGNSIKLFIT